MKKLIRVICISIFVCGQLGADTLDVSKEIEAKIHAIVEAYVAIFSKGDASGLTKIATQAFVEANGGVAHFQKLAKALYPRYRGAKLMNVRVVSKDPRKAYVGFSVKLANGTMEDKGGTTCFFLIQDSSRKWKIEAIIRNEPGEAK